MYLKELVREKQHEGQQISQEVLLGKDVASLIWKKKKTKTAHQREGVADFDVVRHKHLLMLVHVPAN